MSLRHPEARDGEVWLTNSLDEDYQRIGWSTKRRGGVAYDVNGRPVQHLRPVFVQASELEAAGVKHHSPDKQYWPH